MPPMDGMLNKDGWHVTYRSVGTFIILPYGPEL